MKIKKLYLKKNINKYCFVICISLMTSIQFPAKSQLLEPTNVNQNSNLKILEKLLASGSVAPNISGQIFHKNPKTQIASKAEFENSLQRYQINFRNKITILQFWERQCKYSKLALPKLENIYAKYKNKNVQFFAVNTNDFDNKKLLIDFLNKYNNTKPIFDAITNQYYEKQDKNFYKPFDIPILFVSQDNKTRYGVTAFPAVFIIDKKGIVYTALVGYFEGYEEWLSEIIEDLLQQK